MLDTTLLFFKYVFPIDLLFVFLLDISGLKLKNLQYSFNGYMCVYYYYYYYYIIINYIVIIIITDVSPQIRL